MDKPRALHETVIGRRLRLLGRTIRRVPNGRELDRAAPKQWDAHTGLMLVPKR